MSKDAINPGHYKKYPIEVIDMMVAIFGVQATINYCTMTAFKYRMRLGHKDEISQELEKEKWYLNKAQELKSSRLGKCGVCQDLPVDIEGQICTVCISKTQCEPYTN